MSEFADLAGFMPVDTMEHNVLSADGRPTGWVITFNSPAHPKAQAYSDALSRKNLRRSLQLDAQVRSGRKVKPEDRDIEEVRRENIEFIASRIVTWTPVRIPQISNEPLEFSDANVMKVLEHKDMWWLFGQIMDVLGEERSFMPRSVTNSESTPSAPSHSRRKTTPE
jgi:hypothetical protein